MSLSRTFRRAVAVPAALALGGGLALVAAAPANAYLEPTTLEYVGAADIRPDESSYIGWHNGTGTGTYVDGEYGGLELTGKVQILNGFDENADNGDLRELIDDGISWSSGNAYFQIPLFYTADDDSQQFTTLRPADSALQGVGSGDEWTTSRAIAAGVGFAANETATLDELLTALEANAQPTLLGYGFFVDDGQSGWIGHVKWGAEVTVFDPAPVAEPIGSAPFADSSEFTEDDFWENFSAEDAGLPAAGVPQNAPAVVTVPLGLDFALEPFDAFAYSAPTPVGVFTADASGVLTVTIPAEVLAQLAPGEHTLVLASQTTVGEGEQALFSVTFTVVATPAGNVVTNPSANKLPDTGAELTMPLIAAGLVLVAGAGLMLVRRRSNA